MAQPVIETERLIIRELLPEDAPAFFAMDSLPEVHRYLGNTPVTSIEQIHDVIQFVRKQYNDNGIGRWAMIEKSSGIFIGWCGLKLITEELNNHINFLDAGYRLHPDAWGKGYATEGTTASLSYAFTELNARVVYATAHFENTASRRVLEKCGLRVTAQFEHEVALCDWLEITREQWLKKT
jgi:ribosomal-protein-alanine N-acetyltransferase